MKKILKALIITIILLPNPVFATSGFLRATTIKECEGTLYGQHGSDNHWHIAIKNENGSYSAKGNAIYNDPCPVDNKSNNENNNENNSENNEIISNNSKNNDSSLKEITINDEQIEIKDTMEFTTTEENINLQISASDDNAKVEYNEINKLELGNNIVNITVTAQDNTTSKYVLIIVRKEALNSDTSIEIKIDDQLIEFNDYQASIEVKNNVEKLDIEYKLGSDKSKVEIKDNENFVTGKNDVKIIVTAEDGTTQEYIITVTKLDWVNSIIKIILGSSIVVAIVAFVKKFIK